VTEGDFAKRFFQIAPLFSLFIKVFGATFLQKGRENPPFPRENGLAIWRDRFLFSPQITAKAT
jgi:hypothetical protein